MTHLNNKTLLTALAGAWLLAAATVFLVPPAGSQNRSTQTPPPAPAQLESGPGH